MARRDLGPPGLRQWVMGGCNDGLCATDGMRLTADPPLQRSELAKRYQPDDQLRLHAPSEPGIWLQATTAKPSGDGGGDDGPRGLRRVDVGQRMLRGYKRQLSPAADKPSHTPWAALCQDR